jgi:hypothetical protein
MTEAGVHRAPGRAHPVRTARLWRTAGVVLWSSFLAACVESMFFFAYFDPTFLFSRDLPQFWFESRMASYSVGFFFFWAFTAVAATICATLFDTDGRHHPPRIHEEP